MRTAFKQKEAVELQTASTARLLATASTTQTTNMTSTSALATASNNHTQRLLVQESPFKFDVATTSKAQVPSSDKPVVIPVKAKPAKKKAEQQLLPQSNIDRDKSSGLLTKRDVIRGNLGSQSQEGSVYGTHGDGVMAGETVHGVVNDAVGGVAGRTNNKMRQVRLWRDVFREIYVQF
jgi:hypothetical protein